MVIERQQLVKLARKLAEAAAIVGRPPTEQELEDMGIPVQDYHEILVEEAKEKK
jgi:hypothetical protein